MVNDAAAGSTAGSSTLNRALLVLEEIAAGPQDGMTAAQLAAATGANRVTVHRILTSFQRHGFVRQETAGAPYRLGFKLLELAEAVVQERDLVRLTYPVLDELAERTGETCHLAVIDGAEAVYVAKIESNQSIRMVSRIGARVPLYCTALGKALIAAADPDLSERLLARQAFERRTERTHTSPDGLRHELDEIRERGYAIDDTENEAGVRCVGSAVVDHTGRPIAAISVSGPTSRVTLDRAHEFGRLAAAGAADVSAAIGHAHP